MLKLELDCSIWCLSVVPTALACCEHAMFKTTVKSNLVKFVDHSFYVDDPKKHGQLLLEGESVSGSGE